MSNASEQPASGHEWEADVDLLYAFDAPMLIAREASPEHPELDQMTFRVKWSTEDGEFVGLCEQFPSLSWVETNPEDALAGICRLVTGQDPLAGSTWT